MDTTLAANPGALTPAPLLRFALLVAPSALGIGFVLAQALAVEVFARLQWRGLRQSAA